MDRCIYLRKNNSALKFTSAEHIFPKCIGGTKKLARGMVSDEFNNAISSAEKEFAQLYPLVILPRMEHGPKGRKKHSGNFSVGFLQYEGLDFLQIGYIENNTIKTLPQFIVNINDDKGINSVKFLSSPGDNEITYLNSINEHLSDIEFISTDNSLIDNQINIGVINKKLYVGSSEKCSNETIHHFIDEIAAMIEKRQFKKTIKNTNGDITYNKNLSFSVVNISRVLAKIVFNVLASEKGQDFVLRENFIDITKAIVTGDDILKYVSMPECNASKELASFLKLSNHEHFVFIKKEDNCLTGIVCLYGGFASFMVIISNNWQEQFESCGYICDWKNNTDTSLDNYIVKKLLSDEK